MTATPHPRRHTATLNTVLAAIVLGAGFVGFALWSAFGTDPDRASCLFHDGRGALQGRC